MKQILSGLPEELQRQIGNGRWSKNTVGCSRSAVFRVEGIAGGGNAYLKMAPLGVMEQLEREKEVYQWLRGKVPVPEVHYYGRDAVNEYLLLAEIPGESCECAGLEMTPAERMRILGASLRILHNVNIDQCPLDAGLARKLEMAAGRVERGAVDEDDFEGEYSGMTAREVYGLLLEHKPAAEDPVFTHGDYCLPNILIHQGHLSGFIDMGRAGVADRYQDIALMLRSSWHNFGTDEVFSAFMEGYGLTEIDQEKYRYYVLLDELF